MAFITAIGTATPENRHHQMEVAEFMVKAMNLDQAQTRKLRAVFRKSGIDYRHSVLDDYGKTSGFKFYPEKLNGRNLPSTAGRLALYRNNALPLSIQAIQNCLTPESAVKRDTITHLIVVSCTGMYAPGLDIDLVKTLNLNPSVQRTCINFMGCYAAFNALKVGAAFCTQDKDATVLIVCTELCSIHFQNQPTDDNLLANALFADGAAALIMRNTPSPTATSFETIAFHHELATEGENDMAWSIGDFGFEMRLSAYVPDIIQKGIKKLTHALLEKINGHAINYYAIHPGGKKILEVIERELGLTSDQNTHAYAVLREFGNMSSPTVLFVLHRLVAHLNGTANHKHVLSVAFGPGLTLESMILKVHTP